MIRSHKRRQPQSNSQSLTTSNPVSVFLYHESITDSADKDKQRQTDILSTLTPPNPRNPNPKDLAEGGEEGRITPPRPGRRKPPVFQGGGLGSYEQDGRFSLASSWAVCARLAKTLPPPRYRRSLPRSGLSVSFYYQRIVYVLCWALCLPIYLRVFTCLSILIMTPLVLLVFRAPFCHP